MDALERIKKQVTDNPVINYKKGTPDFPQMRFLAGGNQGPKTRSAGKPWYPLCK